MATMNEVRSTYLDYFKSKGHTIVPSASLIPDNDPTLLFTIAGMVQFKDLLLGKETRDYTRAADSQKCVRANDLDNIGYTARHHSFFEMLGNWSFGDYFKEESIAYSWEFLTDVLKLDKSRLYFTVHPSDKESRELWKKIANVGDERVIDIEDNVWAAGDVGPFGFDSEIFYDQGADVAGGLPGTPDEDGDRYLEIWNNVFMEFETLANGEKVNLKAKNVDTGMGLERITSVIQGVKTNYDIDLFQNIIADIESSLGLRATAENIQSFRVISDHLRAMSFLIADGVLPSNQGRGYVLRRIMRRALRHINLLGVKRPALFEMSDIVRDHMGSDYPELRERYGLIRETVANEEEGFLGTLESGMALLDKEISGMSGKVFSGETAFRLYDTYGFPLDLTEDILRKQGATVDTASFEKAMTEQRERSRGASNFKGEAGVSLAFADMTNGVEATEFVGYGTLSATCEVLKCAQVGDDYYAILDKTPFYAESGGQVADKGLLGGLDVLDVKKVHGVFLHKVSSPVAGRVEAAVDALYRADVMHNHSAAHLLQAALRKVVGDNVLQRGSKVGADEFHFDFTSVRAVSVEELAKVEVIVNEWIAAALPITIREMPIEEARATGAIALFGEKYGASVRVVQMGDASVEFCGGTHCSNTSEIGFFKIMRERSVASGVRRIEAITGRAAAGLLAKYGVSDIGGLQAALLAEKAAQEAEAAAVRERKKAEKLAKKAIGSGRESSSK